MEDIENVLVEDAMDVEISPLQESQQATQNVKEGEKRKRKSLKRKRKRNLQIDGNDADFNKHSVLYRCQEELDGLFRYFKNSLVPKLELRDCGGCSNDGLIACLMEGSSLSLPKLAEEIGGKIGMREGVTVEMVRRELPFVGSRVKYGVDNGNLNLGEDESETCLWCWEAREMSLLPKSQRGILKCLRVARKKVHARIAALSETLAEVSLLESVEKSDLLKATEKLSGDMDISEICSLVERWMQKNTANAAEKDVKVKEKEVLKEIEKSKRSAEKEKKRREQELQKEKARNEKELKRLKEEAEKEERRREKEEVERKKLLKSQRDEAEREQKRREKGEVEHKKKASMQRQATMMEKLFKVKRSNNSGNQHSKISANLPSVSYQKNEVISTVISSMDLALSMQDSHLLEDIHKSHIANWHKQHHFNRSLHWGVRRKPKTGVINELKLHGFSSLSGKGNIASKSTSGERSNLDRTLDELEEGFVDDLLGNDVNDIVSPGIQVCNITRKLLQFDKSHRPAYYGSWSKKSQVVGPRRILAKDPDLDYDIDSDEEWEEEEPGESLTDEKDDDEETDDLQVDPDDESEDSFCVPDGYLSENEGVQDDKDDEVASSLTCMLETETEEVRSLCQLQKQLQSLTDKALRKSQPLIVSNLMHEKAGLLTSEDLTGVERIEKICLQVLCMQGYPGGCVVDLSASDPMVEDEVICLTPHKPCASPGAGSILDSYLPEFVKSIQSHSLGISKVMESIQQKYPTLTKTSIRNKVKEIADFVDNHHWQVKSEVLKKLGLHSPPGTYRKSKGIATFFSKRCLPPSKDVISLSDSPSSLKKPKLISSDDNNPHTNPENTM